MTSAKSCKNPERTWFMEMLRRCKALTVLIAVAYFLSNILPILLSYNQFERVVSYAYESMSGTNFFNLIIGIAGGVVVSCAVFRYLHSTDSVIAAHARPQTRTQLFRGSFFAGLLMVTAPVVLTGLLYFCVMGAHGAPEVMKAWSLQFDPDRVLCVANIIGWTLDNIVVIGFTYCVSCFAAILAGTAVIQALLSLLLLSLPSVVYGFSQEYISTFLYGYPGSMDIIGYLSPYGYLLIRGGYLFASVPVVLLIYAAISVLLVFASAAVYKRIRLENEEKTIVVPFLAECLVILLTMVSVSMVLFIAGSFLSLQTPAGTIITVILASAVFFPVFCMIADQSFRIFKGRNVRVFAVYAVAMCLVLAFTLFDLTGYEKRVPAVSEIESAHVVDTNLYESDFKGIKDEELLTRITDLHASIAASKDEAIALEEMNETIEGSDYIGNIQIDYKLKNGKRLRRYYQNITKGSYDEYAQYYNNETVRKHECIDIAKAMMPGMFIALTDTHVDRDGNTTGYSYMVPEDQEAKLLAAANKDIMKWTAENRGLFDNASEYDPAKDQSMYSVDINVDATSPEARSPKFKGESTWRAFTTDDQNLLAYVKAHPELVSEKNIIDPDDPIYGNY